MVERQSLSFTHWSGKGKRPDDYHLVTYILSSSGANTKVSLAQSNIGPKPKPSDKTKAEFAKTFQMMLDGLKQSSENG